MSNTGGVVVGVEVADLPQELVIEILSWLPATNLWPLRFVSKTWFKLLTADPQLANLNSDRSGFVLKNNEVDVGPNILAMRRRMPYYFSFCLSTGYKRCLHATELKSPFDEDSGYYKIWGISNGLVCVSVSPSSSDKQEVYIWNPLTGDHIGIPCLPIQPRKPFYWRHDFFAFCFDQNTKQYKLVRIYNAAWGQFDSHFQLSVYILGKGSSWRIVKEDLPSPYGPLKRNCQIVNGVLHWHAQRFPEPFPYIVGFDLKDEVLRHILLPVEARYYDWYGHNQIVELDGFLCLFIHRVREPIEIWRMQEYGVVNSWTKQFIIGSPEICQFVHWIHPLAVHNGQIILTMENGGLIIYNQKTKSSRKLKGFNYRVVDVRTYGGSIVSPSVISGNIREVRHIIK